MQRDNSYMISWSNLSLINQKQSKHLLKNLNGTVSSGEFVSIMGPSGAGKSSLLSILTARLRKSNTNLMIQGNVLLNNHKYTLEQFSKISAYVQQDDLLFGTLTVRETFFFQAKLKLWRCSQDEQMRKSEAVMKKLNLIECGDTLVGNSQFNKSISGGQKKRVSIGVELLSDPSILVFDEPTSGLDSCNALIITRLLADLAKNERKLIIATIHQPSTLMFQAMDKLYLIKSGQCIFSGPANQIVPYMQQLGVQVDYRMNPADFFMLEISALKEQQGHKTLLNSDMLRKRQGEQAQNQSSYNQEDIDYTLEEPVAPFSYQFFPLLQRSFKNFYRLPSNQLNKLVTAIMIPLMLGIIYFKIGEQVPLVFQQSYLLKLISFLFMGLYFVFAMNIFDMTLTFPAEKQLIFKEVGAGLYSMFAYYITRVLAELVGCLLPSLICGVAVYFMAGLEVQFYHFTVFVSLFIIMALEGYLFGLFFGVLVKDQTAAVNLLPLVVIPILLFAGLVVNINDIPEYVRWLQYFSPLRHSVLIVFQDQLESSNFSQYIELNLAEKYGLGGSRDEAWLCLGGLLVLYFVLSIFFLFMLKKRI